MSQSLDMMSYRMNGLPSYSISQQWVAYLSIIISIFLAFNGSWNHDFVYWDDQYYVTDNIYISNPTWENFKILSTKVISLNYHPLTMWSLWLNSYFFGVGQATPFIITNLVLHTFAACILYKFVERLTKGEMLTAMFVAIIFAIHPMHVESVIWVSERKDVLHALFYFAALLAYINYLDYSGKKYYVLAFLLFLLSCLSKATAVSMVPILVLLTWYRGVKWFSWQSIKQLLPFLLIGLLFGLIAVDVQAGGDFYGLLSNTNIDQALYAEDSNISRWKVPAFGLYFYLKNFVLPTDMSAFHPYTALESQSGPIYGILISALLLAWVIKLLWRGWRLGGRIVFGLGFFFLSIVLVLQWVPVGTAIVADRYTYLPYVGLSLFIGSVFNQYFEKMPKWWSIIFGFALWLGMNISTWQQTHKWRDHSSLFQQVVDRYPNDPRSRMLLATGLWTDSNYQDAIHEMEYAINDLGYVSSEAFETLANAHSDMGDGMKALAFYDKSIALDSLNYTARYHRGLQLMDTDPQAAIRDFDIAENSGFEFVVKAVYGPRGVCHGKLGNYNLAIRDFTKAIDLGMNVADNLKDRAATYEAMGLTDLAAKDRRTI